jgi:hypothetical protein
MFTPHALMVLCYRDTDSPLMLMMKPVTAGPKRCNEKSWGLTCSPAAGIVRVLQNTMLRSVGHFAKNYASKHTAAGGAIHGNRYWVLRTYGPDTGLLLPRQVSGFPKRSDLRSGFGSCLFSEAGQEIYSPQVNNTKKQYKIYSMWTRLDIDISRSSGAPRLWVNS